MQHLDEKENVAQKRPLRRQLYGRRIGRTLSAEHDDLLRNRLPAYRLDITQTSPESLAAHYPDPVGDVWLEIGFGGGEHLAWQAQRHPEIGFIGCEPFITGVAKLLHAAEDAGLRNIRLYDDDARHVLGWLKPASIGRVFVLFPDPWPKKRHRKRRFLQGESLDAVSRVLRPGGILRFATDIADYADMVTGQMARRADFAPHPGLYPERPADWPVTRYEEKALLAGRYCQFFDYKRVQALS